MNFSGQEDEHVEMPREVASVPGTGGTPDGPHDALLGEYSGVGTGVRRARHRDQRVLSRGLGPHIAGTIGPLAAFSPLYNQIVEFNPLKPTEITGDLAKRWEVSSNGLIYTFYLHENVKWWDGKDLTAEDVAFSLKRMIEPGKPRPRVGLLRPYIKMVELVDRNTVKIELNFAAPAFSPAAGRRLHENRPQTHD